MIKLLLGAGESGRGAAILASKMDMRYLFRMQERYERRIETILDEKGIEYEEGKHSEERILNGEEVMKSPGIPEKNGLGKADTGKRYSGDQ